MTSEGRPYARFRRALDVRSVMQAEIAARELGRLGLLDALDYLTLLESGRLVAEPPASEIR